MDDFHFHSPASLYESCLLACQAMSELLHLHQPSSLTEEALCEDAGHSLERLIETLRLLREAAPPD